jgi:DNA-binding transcriptional regulator YhcF (GntR family)
MLPFPVAIQPGESPVKQVVFAASKAILAGVMRAGDPFPSVRDISEELKLHPNTVQTVVREGFLVVRPGVGTVVTQGPKAPDDERRRALRDSVEQIVVDARRLGLDCATLVDEVETTWVNVFGAPRRTGTVDGRASAARRPGGRKA